MHVYQFTITVGPCPVESDQAFDQYVDRIYAAGCDDCTPSSMGDGAPWLLYFDRSGTSRYSAVGSAVRQIAAAGLDVIGIDINSGP